MVPNTRARDALERAFAGTPRAVTVTELARRLSIGRLTVYSWLQRRYRPETPLRLALERELHIPADDWMTDDERRIAYGGEPRLTSRHADDARERAR